MSCHDLVHSHLIETNVRRNLLPFTDCTFILEITSKKIGHIPSTRATVGISLALMRDAQSLALDWKLKLHFLMNSKRLSNIFLFRSSCNIC